MTRQPFDPDPLTVEPQPVRRRTPDPTTGCGCGCAMVAALVAAAIVIGALIVIATSLFAAPSDASSPRSHQGSAHRGAPSTTAVSPGSDIEQPGRQDGGAPRALGGLPEEALHGVATHYPACNLCAAAGPEVKALMGRHWKGSWVTVTNLANGRSIAVRLVTGCACGPRSFHGETYETLIDLSSRPIHGAFDRIASLGDGVIEVQITAMPGLPPTDTAP